MANIIQNAANVAKKPAKKEQSTSFMVNGMEVTLTPNIVRDYLVSGNKDKVSLQEIAMFINMCKFSGLNPWLKEAYCIKYGNEPATMVVGVDAYMKRADENPQYDGMESGIILLDDETGETIRAQGTFYLPGEKIVGGWASVYRKDRAHPTHIEVPFDEYAGKKADGTLNSQWSKKPATMIRKVAKCQALREAFPNSYKGLAVAEEFGIVESDIVNKADEYPEGLSQNAEPTSQPVPVDPTTGEVIPQEATDNA